MGRNRDRMNTWGQNQRGGTVSRWRPYLVGGMFGAAGAVFSIVTRLEAFRLKPCDESRMNYWMSAVRVLMGLMSAIALLRVVPGLLFFSVVYREIQGNTGRRDLPQPRSPPATTALMPPWRSALVRDAALQRPSLVHARCRPRSESRGFPARCEAVDRWQAAAGRARRSARP
jgi:hypothetical protein